MEPIYDASRTRCQEHGERIAALEARVAALEAALITVPILGTLTADTKIPQPPEATP